MVANNNYENIMKIESELMIELKWWEQNIKFSSNPIRRQKYQL